MKVSELIEKLSELEPDRVVILSRDSEGNCYFILDGISTAMYMDYEIGLEELTPELREQGYAEEDVLSDGEKAVVLYPSI